MMSNITGYKGYKILVKRVMKCSLADTGDKTGTKGTQVIRLRPLLDLTSYRNSFLGTR